MLRVALVLFYPLALSSQAAFAQETNIFWAPLRWVSDGCISRGGHVFILIITSRFRV